MRTRSHHIIGDPAKALPLELSVCPLGQKSQIVSKVLATTRWVLFDLLYLRSSDNGTLLRLNADGMLGDIVAK